jgi:hypothetical protein
MRLSAAILSSSLMKLLFNGQSSNVDNGYNDKKHFTE